jgi:hypothetical protein
MHCRPSSFMECAPYKIKVVVGERIEICDESRVLFVVFTRFVAAAHDRALSITSAAFGCSLKLKILRYHMLGMKFLFLQTYSRRTIGLNSSRPVFSRLFISLLRCHLLFLSLSLRYCARSPRRGSRRSDTVDQGYRDAADLQEVTRLSTQRASERRRRYETARRIE